MVRLQCKSKDCKKTAVSSRAFPGRRLFCESHQRQLEAVADALSAEASKKGRRGGRRKPLALVEEDDDDSLTVSLTLK